MFVFQVSIVVVGFVLLAGGEVLQMRYDRMPYATGRQQGDTFQRDAAVFMLRIFGAVALVAGLGSFVLGNHMPPR